MKNKNKVKLYKRLVSLCLAGATLVIVATSCKDNEDEIINTPIETIISEFSESTGLDELFETLEGKDLFEDIVKLQRCLKISEEVNNLNINPILLDSIEIKEPVTLDEYETIFEEYKKLQSVDEISNEYIEKYKLGVILKYYAEDANAFLYNNGYKVAADATLLAVKSLVADTIGVEISNITIPENRDYNSLAMEKMPSYQIDINGKGTITINSEHGIIYDLIGSVYYCQSQNDITKNDEGKGPIYNDARNDKLQKALDRVKMSTVAKYVYYAPSNELISVYNEDEIKSILDFQISSDQTKKNS